MGAPIQWTEEQDHIIMTMRAAGASRAAISLVIGYSAWSIANRMDKIGARKPAPPPKPAYEPTGFAARPPMAPGHPVSWGMLLSHTPSIAGTPYPEYQPIPFRAPVRFRDASE